MSQTDIRVCVLRVYGAARDANRARVRGRANDAHSATRVTRLNDSVHVPLVVRAHGGGPDGAGRCQ
eukprot:4374367-Prymnesium_polylepis.1